MNQSERSQRYQRRGHPRAVRLAALVSFAASMAAVVIKVMPA